eukprot:6094352-Pyramimonas_sp.AAC.1
MPMYPTRLSTACQANLAPSGVKSTTAFKKNMWMSSSCHAGGIPWCVTGTCVESVLRSITSSGLAPFVLPPTAM